MLDPSLTESVLNDMFAVPSKLTPFIVLAVANAVAVALLPVISPVKLLEAVILIPVVIQALFAEFLSFKTLLAVSTQS